VVVEIDRRDEGLLSQSAPGRASFQLSKVLVPIDFSECSQKALQYAVPLAQQFNASLLLVYVMPVHYYVGSEFGPLDVPLPEADLLRKSEAKLTQLAERELADRVVAECRVLRGQPVHELVRVAREEAVDLILLSTHGHTGLKHVLLGSVAENVMRYASCPVLVVREHQREFIPSAGPQPGAIA
jgi:nucleotide-binding universal stress UspA family protein